MFPVFLYLANSSRNAKRTSPPGIGVRFLATRRLYVVKILNGRASYGEFAYTRVHVFFRSRRVKSELRLQIAKIN